MNKKLILLSSMLVVGAIATPITFAKNNHEQLTETAHVGTVEKNGWDGDYYYQDGTLLKSKWLYDENYQSWFYIKEDGTYARNEWVDSYYLKQWGYMAKNEWIYDNGKWYYAKDDGQYASNEWVGSYYLKQWGDMAKNEWIYDNGRWYYAKADGKYASNEWVGSYYLKQWGDMAKNEWIYDNGKWYYAKDDGQYASNEWRGSYYLKQWGDMAKNQWIDYNGKWYYAKADGSYARNQWQGDYYLGDYGQMLINTTTPDGYVVDANGKWTRRYSHGNKYDKSLYGWDLTSEQVAYTDAEARRINNEIITSGMSDREKAKVITAWIFGNTFKDFEQGTEIYKKSHANTAWAVFKNHKAACSGYVRAFKLLGKYAGLKVEIVNENKWTHQWNRVYLADEGKWIECDTQLRQVDEDMVSPKYFGYYLKNIEIDNDGCAHLVDSDEEFLFIQYEMEEWTQRWNNRKKDNAGRWTDGVSSWDFTLDEYIKAVETYQSWRQFEKMHMGWNL